MSELKSVHSMNKDPLIKEIKERDPDFDVDSLANNGERREKLSELREQDSGDSIPTAKERAEEHGYPKVNGQYVIDILVDGKETPTHHHCRLADGGTVHVSKDKFN